MSHQNTLQPNKRQPRNPNRSNPLIPEVEQVVTLPTKKKATRAHQKRTFKRDDAPQQTVWTAEEEIALAKGWLSISENSNHGNERRKAGFWCEVLQYIKSKTKQHDHRTYGMVCGKWKTVHPSVIRFCEIYNNVICMARESGAGEADYV
nr:hypothetical protein [Tanacetum cinerariifolium]